MIDNKYLMKKDLLERGWTLKMIETYMPQHCKFHNERWHVHRDRIKIYDIDRVEKIEASQEWQKELKRLKDKREKLKASRA